MSASPLSSRRLQFRLRTLLIVVTLFCLVVGRIANQARTVYDRKAALADYSGYVILHSFADEGSRAAMTSPVKRWLGDDAVGYLVVSAAVSPDDLKRLRDTFPEAEIELRRVTEVH
jgi:hypothetical protein